MADSIGVIIHRPTGKVVRVFNPDFDWEFAGHHVAADEYLLRVAKDDFAIDKKFNGMTPADVARIVRAMSP